MATVSYISTLHGTTTTFEKGFTYVCFVILFYCNYCFKFYGKTFKTKGNNRDFGAKPRPQS